MKVVDLTHTITEDMPVFPGSAQPKLKTVANYDTDGYRVTEITIFTHTGTHMDPPAHLYEDGTTLDKMRVSNFVGRGLVIDCSTLEAGEKITIDFIKKYGELADKAEFLLFFTGWDINWGDEEYYGDYPVVDEEVIDYLIESKKKGIGLDVIGLDPIPDTNLTLHKRLLKGGDIVIIENLKDLDKLRDKQFIFCALPLKQENADGSLCRAIGILE